MWNRAANEDRAESLGMGAPSGAAVADSSSGGDASASTSAPTRVHDASIGLGDAGSAASVDSTACTVSKGGMNETRSKQCKSSNGSDRKRVRQNEDREKTDKKEQAKAVKKKRKAAPEPQEQEQV